MFFYINIFYVKFIDFSFDLLAITEIFGIANQAFRNGSISSFYHNWSEKSIYKINGRYLDTNIENTQVRWNLFRFLIYFNMSFFPYILNIKIQTHHFYTSNSTFSKSCISNISTHMYNGCTLFSTKSLMKILLFWIDQLTS